MGKPKNEQRQGGKPATSKYAAKKAAEAAGKRDPFQYVGPHRQQHVAVAVPIIPSGVERNVYAHIVRIAPGFMNAKKEDGQGIFIPMFLVQRLNLERKLRIGDAIICDIEPHPNRKGPRATQITSVHYSDK